MSDGYRYSMASLTSPATLLLDQQQRFTQFVQVGFISSIIRRINPTHQFPTGTIHTECFLSACGGLFVHQYITACLRIRVEIGKDTDAHR